jgi:predicted lipoprotein with Yx(FWY)xxD motif
MDTMQLDRTVMGSSGRQSAAGSSRQRARFSIFFAGALTAALSLTALVGPPATASPRPSLSASAMVAVKAATVAKYGKILENQNGLPLYYDTADKPPKHLDCTGGCLSAWPPLVVPKGQKKGGSRQGRNGHQRDKGRQRRPGHLEEQAPLHLRQ